MSETIFPEARTAIVTGAGSHNGIGRGTAERLARDGWSLALFDVDADGVKRNAAELATAFGIAAEAYAVDISDAGAVDAAVADIEARLPPVVALANVAGIISSTPLPDLRESEWDRVFAVNVKGTYLVCRAALPLLRAAGGGAIVNLSSVHALATVERCAAYAASKGAVLALSRQMAIDYAGDNIRVVPLVVGSVDTEMSRQHAAAFGLPPGHAEPDKPALGRMAAPYEIAGVIAFLVSSPAAFLTGSPVVADGGLLTHL